MSYSYLTAASTHLGLPGPKDDDTPILRDIQQCHILEDQDPTLHVIAGLAPDIHSVLFTATDYTAEWYITE